MSIGKLRTEWRNFKKAHPDFEKDKAFKADLGPNLDKFEKAYISWAKQQESCSKDLDNIYNSWKTISTITTAYDAVTGAKNLLDFRAFKHEVEDYWAGLLELKKHQKNLMEELSI